MTHRITEQLAALSLAVWLICLSSAASALGEPGQPNELAQFLQERAGFARALTEPISACVVKHDTSNPVFHGCIDWHSSVHGVWALSAYSWATGDGRYRNLIESLLKPELLAEERQHLAANPEFEMPYGRAWFLRLAIDYRRAFGGTLLDAFADDVAQSLMTYYTRVQPDPQSTAYQSSTWALINLYDYGVMRHDERILGFVRDKVHVFYLGRGPCPLQAVEVDTREFMAVCTNWAWLVGKVLPHDIFKSWLADFLPESMVIEPINDAASVHQVALNFSRAWGLWNLYWMTGEIRFLDAYLKHFNSTYEQPEAWKGDYGTLAHWVAQFGMLALIVSYYDIP